ncbi:MAG: DUF5667 domain-containing protein [Candidatus Magasanikbacteria bacterium]|nr:DUF5667 domain-containing protein [Candidatus Magasanikbacteria bacterium]
MPLIPLIAAILAVLTGAVGGTALIADGAVPGDTLYPIKTEINETVRDFVTVGDEAQAKWEVRKAERRLEEAEELSLRGEMKSLDKVGEQFEKHLEKAKELRLKFEEKEKFKEALEIQTMLEASFSAHERIMDKIRFEAEGELKKIEITDAIKMLQKKIKETRKESVELEEKEFKSGSVLEAVEGKSKALENKLEETENFLERRGEELSSDILHSVNEKITKAKYLINEAGIKVENKEYRDAFQKYQQASRQLQEVKKIMVTAHKLEIKEKVQKRVEERLEMEKEKDDIKDENEEEDSEEDKNEEDKNDEDEDEQGEFERVREGEKQRLEIHREEEKNRVEFEGGAVRYETSR